MIKQILIIGSGVMGIGIAELFANCDIRVNLIDIVVKNNPNKNFLAEEAIKKSNIFRKYLINPSNLDNCEHLFKSADWVIEVVKEDLTIKREIFDKISKFVKPECIVTSNTSTIRLNELIQNFDEKRKKNFVITHFFNPPRFVDLVELISSTDTDNKILTELEKFLDYKLGKSIVKTNDTPGFIANRIGCYWLELTLSVAIENQISVEEVDCYLSHPVGIPATGAFGLFDLIGLDTMELISESLLNSLSENDPFRKAYQRHELTKKMLQENWLGKKTKAGFYRINKDKNGEKVKEVLDFVSGTYRKFETIRNNLSLDELFKQKLFFREIISKTLSYAASLEGIINDDIYNIDQAMKLGYNWLYGPFELVDKIGAQNIIAYLEEQNLEVPKILKQNSKFYPKPEKSNIANKIIDLKNQEIIHQDNNLIIYQTKQQIPIIEFISNNDLISQETFIKLEDVLNKYTKQFQGFVIKGGVKNFALGANLKFLLEKAENKQFEDIKQYLTQGQKTMQLVKNNNIISAVSGYAFGGGAELLLHSKAVFAHSNSFAGLVESKVGLTPGWGGCKEMILKADSKEVMIKYFSNILSGKVSEDAFEIKNTLGIINHNVVPNIKRVLDEAVYYLSNTVPEEEKLSLVEKKDINWQEILERINPQGYDLLIGQKLIEIFSSNKLEEQVLFDKEQEVFLSLIGNYKTQERIKYMLKTGKKLEN